MTAMFLGEPPASEAADALYDQDLKEDGYVWNLTRLWTWRPDVLESFVGLRSLLMNEWGLTDRDRAVLVAAVASELGDSYCSLAWGAKLASLTDDETASLVLTGAPAPELSERESALAAWARQIVRDPNSTTEKQVSRLRELGLGDREVFEATAFIALRLAFSTINDALGAAPDEQLAADAPERVREAVSYGRPPSSA
jgi:uncharacterized peroxidase-related enzyme